MNKKQYLKAREVRASLLKWMKTNISSPSGIEMFSEKKLMRALAVRGAESDADMADLDFFIKTELISRRGVK